MAWLVTEPELLAMGLAVAETPPKLVLEIIHLNLLREDTCSVGYTCYVCFSLNDCMIL